MYTFFSIFTFVGFSVSAVKNCDLEKISNQSLWMRASLPLWPCNSDANNSSSLMEKEKPKIDFGHTTDDVSS